MTETDAMWDPIDAWPAHTRPEPAATVPIEESAGEVWEEQEPAPGPSLIATLIPTAVVGAVLAWSYRAELSWCWETWSTDPNYSHGFLVIPVAIGILWLRLRRPGPISSRPWHVGWALLLLLLIGRAVCYDRGYQWSAAATLLPVLLTLAVTLGGLTFIRRSWPALAYLVFLLPLPNKVSGLLAQPLQNLATTMSVTLLKISGLWVLAEGNVIFVGKDPIMVAEACNGLSMMMTLAATVAAAAFMIPASAWVRIVLGLSIVPIALVSNVLRISATAWSVHWFGAEVGGKRAHDIAGWLMMPVAFILVLIEMKVLRWLIVEELVVNEPLLLGRPISASRGERGHLPAPRAEAVLDAEVSESPASSPSQGDGQGEAHAGN